MHVPNCSLGRVGTFLLTTDCHSYDKDALTFTPVATYLGAGRVASCPEADAAQATPSAPQFVTWC